VRVKNGENQMSSNQKDLEGKGKKETKYEVVPDADFTEGFDKKGIQKSALLDINPPLSLKDLVDGEKTIEVVLSGEPRKVLSDRLPKGEAWFINAYHDGILHSMVIPNSLRHSLAVLQVKNEWEGFNGHNIRIISQYGKLETPTFKGEAKTYKAVMPEKD